MRLLSLKVHDSKNLKGFEVSFDEKSPCTVFVGRNGSGKSNLFEALGTIFNYLEKGKVTPFSYELEYLCRGRRIRIDTDLNRIRKRARFYVDEGTKDTNKPLSFVNFKNRIHDPDESLLPDFIFGYYSGECNRFKKPFDNYALRYTRRLRNSELGERIPRRFLYGSLSFAELLIVALWAHSLREQEDSSILEMLDIQGIRDVRLTLRPPELYNPEIHDPRSLGLKGALREFIAELEYADVRGESSTVVGNKLHRNFLFDKKGLGQLAAFALKRETNLFGLLLECKYERLLSSFSCRLEMANGASIRVDDLSEGEKQLAIVMGMIRFSQHEESLFLLDEPDTHLNPTWSAKYLDILQKDVNTDRDHILLATHDPLVVSGLYRSQVRIMKRDPETGRIDVEEPDFDPVGMGVAAILTSDVFGLSSTLDINTQRLLDERRRLVHKARELDAEELVALVKINKSLEVLGFTSAVRDPLYERFSKLWTKREDIAWQNEPSLSEEQRKAQEKLAAEIIDQMLRDEGLMP